MRFYYLLLFILLFSSCAESLSKDQEEFIDLLNNFRRDKNLDRVIYDANLNDAAKKHSEDMAKNDFLDHTGSDNSSFDERILDTGYFGSPIMENIAYNMTGKVEDFMTQWQNSAGHNANMSIEYIQEIGFYIECKDEKCYATLVAGSGGMQ